MGDRWIVSSYSFYAHNDFATAVAEQGRLSRKHPNKRFRLYRVKTDLRSTDSERLNAWIEIEALRCLLDRALAVAFDSMERHSATLARVAELTAQRNSLQARVPA